MPIESTTTPRRSEHPGTGLVGFLVGATYPFRGVVFLARNRVAWRYAAVPGAVNFVILAGAMVASFFFVDDLAAWLRPEFLVDGGGAATGGAPDPARSASGLLAVAGRGVGNVLLHALSFLLAASGAVVVALLVAAGLAGPFQERLSEVVEHLATGRPARAEPFAAAGLVRDGARAVSAALQRAVLFGALYVPLLALSFFPVVGIVGAAGTFVYSAFFGALNFMDPTLERSKLPLRGKLMWARSRAAPWLGYGSGLLVLLLVPLVGLVLTPAFVAGGTLLWLDARDDA